MKKINLNLGWQYSHAGSEDWKEVILPHDAMLAEPRNGQVPGGKNTGWFTGSNYIYRRELFVQRREDIRYVIEFEGVYHNARVYLNNEEVAFRPYGYTNFYIDITNRLYSGKNLLEVYVCNADQPNSRWYSGAGLYRSVWLYELPARHIELNGIRIRTADYTKGEICIEVRTSHGGTVQVEILDGEKVVVKAEGEGVFCIAVPQAKLWSTEYPHQYKCRVTYGEDIQEERFGIRGIEYSAEKGFCINGRRVILRGACIHHDNGLLGACAFPAAEERKVRLLRSAGYNAIRSSHNPCSKALLQACDCQGMLIVDEYVDMWYIHKTKYDYASYFEQWWQRDLADMIDKDYNHPSVVMYSLGNEVSETARAKGIKLSAEMRDFVHERDDTRPVTCGVNMFFNYLSVMGFGVYSDKKAAKEKNKEREVGSAFFNKLAGIFGDKTMKMGALLHGCDVFTRRHFAEMDIAGYNYGILRYKRDLQKYPSRVIVGTETFVRDTYRFTELVKDHPALIGDFVWTGIDYLGEVGLGAMEYRNYAKNFTKGPGWIAAGCGSLDLTGKETGEALYTKVAYGVLPIAIAVQPPDNAGEEHSPSAWRMTNARPSWSWNGCNGKKTVIEVYCRAYEVRLFINTRLVGHRRLKRDCRAVFRAAYMNGCVLAIGYGKDGKEICRMSLVTEGEETQLTAMAEQVGIGRERLVYIRLQYTDREGNLKPLARGEVRVQVQGGELIALGNGCPYNETGYLQDRTDTYFGEALAIVRPTETKVSFLAESAYGNASVQEEITDDANTRL